MILIGGKTVGKNVAISAFENNTYGITLWPVVAYVSNANHESDYANGFQPHYLLNEENQLTWFPLGDTNEYYLKNTLSLIETGSMPDILQTEEKQQSVHAHYNSIEAQNCQGVILSTQK